MNCYNVVLILFIHSVTSRPKDFNVKFNLVKLFVNGKPFKSEDNLKIDNDINDIQSIKEFNKENQDKKTKVKNGVNIPTDKMETPRNNKKRLEILKGGEENYNESTHVLQAYVPISEDIQQILHGIILMDVNKDALQVFGMN